MLEEMNLEVDEEDNVIGLRPRSDFYLGRRIHRASDLIILTYRERILLQKRALTKALYPGLWDYPVSETVKDESYFECITRGAKEQLGLDSSTRLYDFFRYFASDDRDKAWHMVFLTTMNNGATQRRFQFNQREIDALRWFSQGELKKSIEQSPQAYTPPLIKGLREHILF